MRLAICFSGYINEWKDNSDGWLLFINLLKNKYNCDIDIFCHMWNFNKDNLSKVSNNCIYNFLDSLKPISYEVNDLEILEKIKLSMKDDNNRFIPLIGEMYDELPSDDFYSLMVSAHLKKQHEIKIGQQYDVCFKIKYDFFFTKQEIVKFIEQELNEDINLKYNTIYSSNVDYLKVDNSFWFSDSVTFNKISEINRWVPTLGKRGFNFRESISADEFIFFYIKMFKMEIQPIFFKPEKKK